MELLSSVKEVSLNDNAISKVDFRLFKTVKYQQPGVIKINLKNNLIECNCFNYDLHLFLNKKCFGNLTSAIQFKDNTHCSNGVSLANLTNMNCPIKPNCPSGCSCTFSTEENIILINCASIHLKKMPVSSYFTKLTDFEWFKSYLIKKFKAEFPNCITRKLMLNLDLSGNFIEVVDYVPANLRVSESL